MAPDATSNAAPTIPNQDRRGCDVPAWLPIPVTTCSRDRWFKILYNRTDALSLRILVVAGEGGRARTDPGTGMPARRAGAGCRSAYRAPEGRTAAHVAAAPPSAGSGCPAAWLVMRP